MASPSSLLIRRLARSGATRVGVVTARPYAAGLRCGSTYSAQSQTISRSSSPSPSPSPSPSSYSYSSSAKRTRTNGGAAFGALLLAGWTLYSPFDVFELQLEPLSLEPAHQTSFEREDHQEPRPLRFVPLSTLLRSYFVYSVCSIPPLVDAGPAIIDWCAQTSLPGVWTLTQWLVRGTFFAQFVGGDTAEECIPLLSELSRSGLGQMLNYSVEMTDKKSSASKQEGGSSSKAAGRYVFQPLVEELCHSVDVAASFADSDTSRSETGAGEMEQRPSRAGSTSVAIKLSGLMKDASVLERASAAIVPHEWFSAPPVPAPPRSINGSGPISGLAIPVAALKPDDVHALKELWESLRRVAQRAKESGSVRLIIDAEHSWLQPAIDAMYEALAAEFNRVPSATKHREPASGVPGPLVFNTFQAYLRRTPSHLAASLERARAGGYMLGVKLVRGAYVGVENATWASKAVAPPPQGLSQEERDSPNRASPVWASKALTDACFDGCALRLVEEVAKELKQTAEGSQPRLSVIFATHNMQSALRVCRKMLSLGLVTPPSTAPSLASGAAATPISSATATSLDQPPELIGMQIAEGVRGRIAFAQLYGMADGVTRRIQLAFDQHSGGEGPHIGLKYVPYGPLELVMPYLVRRALENKSVMGGGASKERVLLGAEIRRRLVFM